MEQPTLPSPPAQALPINEQKKYDGNVDGDDGDGDNGDGDDDGDEDDCHHVDDSGGDHSLPFPLQALHSEALALGK